VIRYSVYVTRSAADDVVEIIRYISDGLRNTEAAERHLEWYLDTVSSLAEMPNRFALSNVPALRGRGVRFVPFGNYMIAYAVDEPAKAVYVLRVLYAMSDLNTRLGEE